MRLIVLLIAALFISSALTLKVLRGDQVPKDYPIGRISQVDFTSDGRIFFEATSYLLGFMDAKTGTITALFMLEEDEKVISYMGYEGIVISKGKEVNIFSPIQDQYIKLQYSDYLKTQTFTNIIAFKRYFMFDYILSDEFLLKAKNPYAPEENPFEEEVEKVESFQILAKKGDGEKLLSLVFLGDRESDKVGMGLLSMKSSQKQICLDKFYIDGLNITDLCYKLDQNQKFKEVLQIGENIMVIYKKTNIILSLQMKKEKETFANEMITYVNELKIVSDPTANKNLNSQALGQTIMFFNQAEPNGANNLQSFEREMLLKKDDKVQVSIQKSISEVTMNVWANTYQNKEIGLVVIMEFANGKIVAYKVDVQKKQASLYWEQRFGDFKKLEGADDWQAKEVDLKAEEKIIEKEESGEGEDNEDLGEIKTETAPLDGHDSNDASDASDASETTSKTSPETPSEVIPETDLGTTPEAPKTSPDTDPAADDIQTDPETTPSTSPQADPSNPPENIPQN